MATAEETGRFTIETEAFSMLGELSSDLADAVMEMAYRIAVQDDPPPEGKVAVITVCHVAAASEVLCSAIEEAIKSQRLPADGGAAVLAKVRSFCARASKECGSDGGQPAPAG